MLFKTSYLSYDLTTEVVADETPAVDVVLKADFKRTALLSELKKLEEESSTGNLKNQERITEVRG